MRKSQEIFLPNKTIFLLFYVNWKFQNIYLIISGRNMYLNVGIPLWSD